MLLALVVNDARRGMHKTMKEWIAEAESLASHHNERMQKSHDQGNAEMAKIEAEQYMYWTRTAKRWSRGDWLLP